MALDRPWVRGALPWLRSGPVWRVATVRESALDVFLADHAYRRLDLDGGRMTSRHAAHAELARVFGFPDYYGANWDAFNDVMHDVVATHRGERLAVVWHDIEAAAAAAPVTTAEVVWALLEVPPGRELVLDLFVIGEGDDFDGH